MPSPLGHALASVAAGWGVAGAERERRALLLQVAILAAVGLAPDLDLLLGRHSGETHSIGAAMLVATVAALMRWPVASTRLRIWAAVFFVWTLHPIFDAMAPHVSPPFGVMLYWPFSQEHVEFSFKAFMPISRRYWLPGFVSHTVLAVGREVIILGPVVAIAWWRSRRVSELAS